MPKTEENSLLNSYGIILLAAGQSARLGKPKQLLNYKGKTLLAHSLQIAIETQLQPIVTVLGANLDTLKQSIEPTKTNIVINQEWSEGMASSIRCGIEELLKIAPSIAGVIIMVCDQPYVTAKLLTDLVEKHEDSSKPIIASRYNNNIGTPALFDKTIFALLLSLKGDSGAKKIMKSNPDWVDTVNFPFGEIDIDTSLDYELLMKDFKNN
jgi:molybdenum cofactor cytidylyltransferase